MISFDNNIQRELLLIKKCKHKEGFKLFLLFLFFFWHDLNFDNIIYALQFAALIF